MSNEEYQAELKRSERANRLGVSIPSTNGTQMMGGFSIFSIVVVIVALMLFALGIFFFVISARNQTTNSGNCTKGDQGIQGIQGVRGLQGEKGDKGDKGDQGDQGVPGEKGDMGMCLNTNPACQKGDTGPPGTPGMNGTQGPIGLTGLQGIQGIQGPPGIDGRNGTDGINGINGTNGAQGDPGICDCLNLTYASYATVNITDQLRVAPNATFVFDGFMDCSGGGVFSPTCLNPLTCTNFSTCDLEANSLLIKNWGLDNSLYFSKTNVTFTSRSPYASMGVSLGSSILPNNQLTFLNTYATTSRIEASTNLLLGALFGTINIQTGSSSSTNDIFIDSLAAKIIMSAATGIQFINAAGTISFTAGSASSTISNAGAITTTASQFILTVTPNLTAVYNDGIIDHFWISSNANHSYSCQTFNISNPALQLDTTRTMTQIGPNADLILEANSFLGSTTADGLVQVRGGFSLTCSNTIRTSTPGDFLYLTGFVNDRLSIAGMITNIGAPVQINSIQGLDLQDTSIFNSAGGGVNITDTTGVYITNGQNVNTSTSFLAVNQIRTINPLTEPLLITSLNINANATGLIVNGTIHATGDITSDSMCCTSDIRVKQNLKPVSAREDLETVLRFPRRVSFQYTDEYKLINKKLSRNITYDGFVAQEMEAAGFPTLVTKSSRPVVLQKSGQVIDDLLGIQYENAVPYLIGAIRALYEEQVRMTKKIKVQNKTIKALKKRMNFLKK